jgi:hypothetical protein
LPAIAAGGPKRGIAQDQSRGEVTAAAGTRDRCNDRLAAEASAACAIGSMDE